MIIIGEKINGSIPSVAEAIAKRDADFIKQRAIAQAEAGATFIDCCASVPEAEAFRRSPIFPSVWTAPARTY